jgi:hemolysin activation/secretion protein
MASRRPSASTKRSSIAASGALGGDYDYRRHVLDVRRYTRLSPRQTLNLRAIAGIGEGTLPPQRLLSIGGFGTVPGYDFKQENGGRMVFFDAEYGYRLSRHIRPLLLYDAGRVFRPLPLSGDEWLQAFGTGLDLGDGFRIEAFWPLDRSRPAEILIRLRPAF